MDRVRREDRLAAVLVDDVGGEELELGAVEPVAVAAAVDRMAAVGPAGRSRGLVAVGMRSSSSMPSSNSWLPTPL